MEFLRFGGYIPGEYWGCCAVDIIQNFNQDPDDKASIQIVSGDSGSPITKDGELVFAGPTYRDIFWQRIRVGTFNSNDKPNHTFLAVLTASQLGSSVGKKWLAILAEAGFEFVRAIDNSVYTGKDVYGVGSYADYPPHPNYLFGLFRNIGNGKIANPFEPPKEWTKLKRLPEANDFIQKFGSDVDDFVKERFEKDTEVWNAHPDGLKKESEIVAAGAPVMMAGLIPKHRVEEKSARIKRLEAETGVKAQVQTSLKAKSSPAG